MVASSGDTAIVQRPFTIKTFLVPLLTRPKVAMFIKYTVYLFLLINFALYIQDDYLAFKFALPPGAPMADILEQFSTSIDMAAWLGLVFLFELETHTLPDDAFKDWVPKAFIAVRLICYLSIGFAAYGFTVETLEYYDVSRVSDMTSACDLAGQGVALQLDVIRYQEITTDNCAGISADTAFYQIESEVSVIGESTLKHSQIMGWIDVDNAYVWIIVVILIEIEVWMQAADRFSSRLLTAARQVKTILYLVLVANGVIWATTGYPLYAWDAFLWIFGFWAIELNLAEWEQDRIKELRASMKAST